MKEPRLCQPLFSRKVSEKYEAASQLPPLDDLVRAYDCIWTLLYEPIDITPADRANNAHINLIALGRVLETLLGEDVFETDPRQMTFDIPYKQPGT